MSDKSWGLVAVLFIAFAGGGLTLLAATVGPNPGGQYTAYSHASDYSWVAGRLERSPLEGGFWRIVYQRDGQEPDEHGGQFVLGNPPQLEDYSEGDLVVIFGQIAEEQVSIFQAGTLYEVERVQPLQDPT